MARPDSVHRVHAWNTRTFGQTTPWKPWTCTPSPRMPPSSTQTLRCSLAGSPSRLVPSTASVGMRTLLPVACRRRGAPGGPQVPAPGQPAPISLPTVSSPASVSPASGQPAATQNGATQNAAGQPAPKQPSNGQPAPEQYGYGQYGSDSSEGDSVRLRFRRR